MSALIAASSLILGRKSTTYSAPRYSSVWPFCRPKPLTSVTVMPCTPIAERASRTSSSLNGLMMAVTSFMISPRVERSERLLGPDDVLGVADVLAEAVRVQRARRVRSGDREAQRHAEQIRRHAR